MVGSSLAILMTGGNDGTRNPIFNGIGVKGPALVLSRLSLQRTSLLGGGLLSRSLMTRGNDGTRDPISRGIGVKGPALVTPRLSLRGIPLLGGGLLLCDSMSVVGTTGLGIRSLTGLV